MYGETNEAVGRVGEGRARLQIEQVSMVRGVVERDVIVVWGDKVRPYAE